MQALTTLCWAHAHAQGNVAYKPKRGDALMFYDVKPDYLECDHNSMHTGCECNRNVSGPPALPWIAGLELACGAAPCRGVPILACWSMVRLWGRHAKGFFNLAVKKWPGFPHSVPRSLRRPCDQGCEVERSQVDPWQALQG